MQDWILTVEDAPPWDGSYPLGESLNLKRRELGWMRRLTGYQPVPMIEALMAGDAEIPACLAAIALHRAGKIEADDVPRVYETLLDTELGSITMELVGDDEEADADGPPPPRSDSNSSFSGDDSTNTLVISPDPPKTTGVLNSASSVWPQTKSET